MKKYGFTLIEVIVSIFILTILFSVSLSLSKLRANLSTDIENSEYMYEIQNLLSYAKAVCREKNKVGKITVRASKNEIRFVEGWDKIEKVVTLPKGVMIISGDDKIFISDNGKIERGFTIKINDKNRENHEIRIGVGVDKWSVYNEKTREYFN